MNYKILCFDGGGIRGVISLQALKMLEEASGIPIVDNANLIAGTSAGAINTVGLGLGLTTQALIDLYQNQGPTIFRKDWLSSLFSAGGLLSSRFSTSALKKGLIDGFKAHAPTVETAKLGDLALSGRHSLINTFQLDSGEATKPNRSWKAKFFHSFPEDNDGNPNPDLNEKALDLVIRSAAAPSLFPLYQGYADGALLANNPVMCAVAQALNKKTGKQSVQDLRVLSFSTGRGRRKFLKNKNDSWGLLDWANHLDMFADAFVGTANYQASQLLGTCYQRFDPEVSGIDAGDGKAATRAIKETNDYFKGPGAAAIKRAAQWVQDEWK